MIYVVNTVLILVYALILKPDKYIKRNRKIFCIIVALQLACINGFQYDVGADYLNYLRIYEAIANMSWTELSKFYYWKEPIFCIYSKIMADLFHNNFTLCYFGMALATSGFLMKALYDRKESIFWSTYLYVSMGMFYISMNQIRQMLAISILLFCIRYMEERNWKKYLFWILFAAGIHNAILIMLPFYFVKDMKLKNRKKTTLILFVGCLIFYFGAPFIVNSVLSQTSYGWMLAFESGETNNMIINLLFRTTLLIGCIYYMKPILLKNSNYGILYWIAISGIVFQVLSIYATSVARITTYFYVIFIILIPIVISAIPKWRIRLFAKMVIFIGMLCYHIFYFMRLGIMDYQTVFSIL